MVQDTEAGEQGTADDRAACAGECRAPGCAGEADDADAFIVERIAEAVVRKIDERDKINLLAEAVIARLQELQAVPDVTVADRPERQRRSRRPRTSPGEGG